MPSATQVYEGIKLIKQCHNQHNYMQQYEVKRTETEKCAINSVFN
jgi:hypothetical protein